jgi:hypothetical protein
VSAREPLAASVVSRAFRVAAGVMAALFLVSAAVQWNDPDPVYWIAVYGAAAVLAARAAQGDVPLIANLIALLAFALLAGRALPDLLAAREAAFTHWQMLDSSDELAREAGGLLLCAAWSAVQTAVAWRARGLGSGSN